MPATAKQPSAVTVVVRAPTAPNGDPYRAGARAALETLEVSWRQVGPKGVAVLVVFLAICLGVLAALHERGALSVASDAIFLLAFGAIAFSVLRIRAKVLVTAGDVVVEQQKMFGRHEARVAFGDVAEFRSQVVRVGATNGPDASEGYVAHDVCAILKDGRTVRVVAEIVDPHVAEYVTQLLADRLRSLAG